MKARSQEVNTGEFERPNSFVLRPPIHEILGNPELARGAFDISPEQEASLREQIAARRELARFTQGIIDSLPSPHLSLDTAMAQGDISPLQVIELYARLSNFLRNPAHARVVLYMPFEWLPDAHDESQDATLSIATDEFREAYVSAWWSLLREHDIRAQFDDGDLRLDIDKNPDILPRVIKAAHLIPFLLEKGVINEEDVRYIYDGTNSEVLRQSIDDAMRAYEHRHETQEKSEPIIEVTTEHLHSYHEQQLQYAYAEREADASPQRLEWLKKVAFETTVKDTARALASQPEGIVQAGEFITSDDELVQSTGCVALGRIAESTHSPKSLAQSLASLHEYGSTDMKYYSMTMRRLYRMGLVDMAELTAKGVSISRLHGELSKNLDLDSKEMEIVRTYIDTVRKDGELSASLYPAVLVGGSRLKGYGDEHSDIDMTVYVRPGVDEVQREELLARIMPLLGGDKPHELWLDQTGNELKVRMIETDDTFVGNDHWVHILFGAAWIGDDETIKELQSKLLPPYFKAQYYSNTDMPLQPAYRKRIEDDVLLYRLLHRGYAHQYPAQESLDMPYADAIDGNGVFYDAGYRQLATQLFIEKVFLPTI